MWKDKQKEIQWKKNYFQGHKEEFSNRRKKWRKENSERDKSWNREYAKKWRKKNRERYLEHARSSYIKQRKFSCNRINQSMAGMIRQSLAGKKKGRKWEMLAGYTVEELIKHLEKSFSDKMTWENYGKWHIDHIKPRSLFKYETAEDPEFRKCWALKNLQPLWAKENLSKGNRYGNL